MFFRKFLCYLPYFFTVDLLINLLTSYIYLTHRIRKSQAFHNIFTATLPFDTARSLKLFLKIDKVFLKALFLLDYLTGNKAADSYLDFDQEFHMFRL